MCGHSYDALETPLPEWQTPRLAVCLPCPHVHPPVTVPFAVHPVALKDIKEQIQELATGVRHITDDVLPKAYEQIPAEEDDAFCMSMEEFCGVAVPRVNSLQESVNTVREELLALCDFTGDDRATFDELAFFGAICTFCTQFKVCAPPELWMSAGHPTLLGDSFIVTTRNNLPRIPLESHWRCFPKYD